MVYEWVPFFFGIHFLSNSKKSYICKLLFLILIISMKDKTIRNIRLCSYTALAFCAIWAILMVVHFVLLFGGNESIDWSKNSIWKIGLIVLYIVSMIICVLLCAKIVINIFNGLRENTAFPKSNVKLLFWLAVAFLSICYVGLMSR